MRKEFASELLKYAKEDNRIILLTGDLGFGIWDDFKSELPNQFYNVGAAEQCMLDIAVGLALSGKIPFCYSITPFLIYRAFETIRTYINHESINVKLLGSGIEGSYKSEGFSHSSDDVSGFMSQFENIEHKQPPGIEEIPLLVEYLVNSNNPAFVGLMK